MSTKMQKKCDQLFLSNEKLKLYETTLKEKYDPVFEQMEETIKDK